MARKRRKKPDRLAVLQPDAAGIDIGARELYVAVPADRADKPVRSFPSFTRDLNELADWLEECSIRTVAMESTSVYWIPVYQILESRGIEVCLVNARYVKNVPGRKSDVSDCQWIQYLHSVGLLRASFRPPGEICAIRSLWRHRSSLIQMAAEHVLHMQKSLDQMNEPPRVSRRLHYSRGWESSWEDQVDIHQKFESVQSGWCSSIRASTTHSGPHWRRSPRRSVVRPRPCESGLDRQSVTQGIERA